MLRGCEVDIVLVNDVEYVGGRGGPEGRVAKELDQKSCSGVVDLGLRRVRCGDGVEKWECRHYVFFDQVYDVSLPVLWIGSGGDCFFVYVEE